MWLTRVRLVLTENNLYRRWISWEHSKAIVWRLPEETLIKTPIQPISWKVANTINNCKLQSFFWPMLQSIKRLSWCLIDGLPQVGNTHHKTLQILSISPTQIVSTLLASPMLVNLPASKTEILNHRTLLKRIHEASRIEGQSLVRYVWPPKTTTPTPATMETFMPPRIINNSLVNRKLSYLLFPFLHLIFFGVHSHKSNQMFSLNKVRGDGVPKFFPDV